MHKGLEGQKDSSGLAGSGVHRAGLLLAVAASTQSIPGLRGQGKTAER